MKGELLVRQIISTLTLAAELSVRAICQLRMNSLFSYSITGAEDNAIIESLAETAKENHANPRICFRYLIDRMTDLDMHAKIMDQLLEELMPIGL